jgi:hypothetical protein
MIVNTGKKISWTCNSYGRKEKRIKNFWNENLRGKNTTKILAEIRV